MPETPVVTLQVGERIDDFEVKAITPLEELRAVAYQIEHEPSGARLMHLHADDAENLFSISFPTPPSDDTGVPHILEHGVLAGSRRYPVKEPFFEMIKMSMATFINAMTGWDCTYYPVASNVKQDLFNLAEVYFDAVFHPLLTEQTFKREGHHLAPADPANPTGDLTVSGIVYNEMKGAFSDPESLMYRSVTRGLLPDTIYSNESGGDPVAIPDLTYPALKQFHKDYYHPSNGYFFFYGNIPTLEYLAFLTDRLKGFARQTPEVNITRQPRWEEPRSLTDTYPVASDEPLTEKTYLMLQWLAGDATDPEDAVLMHILSLILLGNEAAPLKKSIIESKLGADLIYSGAGAVGLEGNFRVGLKGSEPDRVDAFANLAIDTLSEVANIEIEPELVEAAFQQAAYHFLEIGSMFPLEMLDRVISTWIYGTDPLTFLPMAEHLSTCKRKYEAEPSLFNRLIRERLLENPHRLTAVVKPDRKMQGRIDTEFADRMAKVRSQLTDAEMKQIAADAEELDRLNSEPNAPEALAKLPQLKVTDLPNRLTHIPTTIESVHGVELLHNDVFANGINYLILNFNLQGLPEHLWKYLPRYAEAIRKLGAAGVNYEQMARRVAASTGGIGCAPGFGTHASNGNQSLRHMRFQLKTLDDQIAPALSVFHDLLFSLDPRDSERLRDVLVQSRARYRTDMVHNGSSTAMYHAARGLNPESYLNEQVSGLPQLSLSEELNAHFDEQSGDLMGKIDEIRDFLLVRGRVTASFTGSDSAFKTVSGTLSDWVGKMRDETIAEIPVGFTPFEAPPREGLAGPIQVAHCAQVIPAPHASHPDQTLLTLGAHMVRLDYIMNEIRFKGNAYGAWFTYSPLGRTLYLGSYNDPHISRTLQVFNGVTDFVHGTQWTQTDIDRAIIATAKNYEQPIRPNEATSDALHRHLTGQTPEKREERYARLKSGTPQSVKRALLGLLESNLNQGAVCVVSSREKLEAANQEMSDNPLAIEDILQ